MSHTARLSTLLVRAPACLLATLTLSVEPVKLTLLASAGVLLTSVARADFGNCEYFPPGTLTVNSTSNSVTLNWTPWTSGFPAQPVYLSRYFVERAVNGSSTYTALATVNTYSVSDYTYTDTTAQGGNTYVYRVLPDKSCGVGYATSSSVALSSSQEVRYYLNHGIGDTTPGRGDGVSESAFFGNPSDSNPEGSKLRNWLARVPGAGAEAPAVAWDTLPLIGSSTQVADRIQATGSASSVQNIIVVGYSQGAARSRYYLQQLASNPQYSGSAGKVRALVTISGVNGGAPVVDKAESIGATLAATVFGPLSLNPVFAFASSLWGGLLGTGLLSNFSGQYARDMSPNSSFMQQLNTSWRSDFKPLPNTVATLQILGGGAASSKFDGRGNDIDQYIGPNIRKDALIYGTVLTASFAILGFFWAPAWNLAALAGVLVGFALSLPSFWRTDVVGSNDGDALVPLEYQMIYGRNNALAVGGDSLNRYERFVPNGFHTTVSGVGTYESPLARAAMCRLQDRLRFAKNNHLNSSGGKDSNNNCDELQLLGDNIPL